MCHVEVYPSLREFERSVEVDLKLLRVQTLMIVQGEIQYLGDGES